MAHMKVNTFQVHKVYRGLHRRPTTALTNQVRYLGVLYQPWPIKFTTLTNKNNIERSQNLDSATTVAQVLNVFINLMRHTKSYFSYFILNLFFWREIMSFKQVIVIQKWWKKKTYILTRIDFWDFVHGHFLFVIVIWRRAKFWNAYHYACVARIK